MSGIQIMNRNVCYLSLVYRKENGPISKCVFREGR